MNTKIKFRVIAIIAFMPSLLEAQIRNPAEIDYQKFDSIPKVRKDVWNMFGRPKPKNIAVYGKSNRFIQDFPINKNGSNYERLQVVYNINPDTFNIIGEAAAKMRTDLTVHSFNFFTANKDGISVLMNSDLEKIRVLKGGEHAIIGNIFSPQELLNALDSSNLINLEIGIVVRSEANIGISSNEKIVASQYINSQSFIPSKSTVNRLAYKNHYDNDGYIYFIESYLGIPIQQSTNSITSPNMNVVGMTKSGLFSIINDLIEKTLSKKIFFEALIKVSVKKTPIDIYYLGTSKIKSTVTFSQEVGNEIYFDIIGGIRNGISEPFPPSLSLNGSCIINTQGKIIEVH